MQLQMIWPESRLHDAPSWTLPRGYSLRTYREGDAPAYVRLMNRAAFESWSGATARETSKRCLPKGIFFAVHDDTGLLAATTCAVHNPDPPLHPSGGELGWAAADPDHRGKGLGYVTSAAVTRRFLDAGYTRIYLRTDDHRLAAIKTYLKLGYVPLLHASDMEARWRRACDKLRVPFQEMEIRANDPSTLKARVRSQGKQ